MAGFAVFMTFLTWGLFLLVIAIILSVLLRLSAKRACPESTAAAGTFRIASTLAPFLGLLWLPVALKVHVGISNNLAHQSVGFSPDPYVTLPNGFRLGSLNTYDGYVVAPGFNTDVPVTGPGYVRSIIDIAWVGDTFRGSLFDFKSSSTQNFIFNTKTLHIETSPVGPTTWDAANDRRNSARSPTGCSTVVTGTRGPPMFSLAFSSSARVSSFGSSFAFAAEPSRAAYI